MLDSRAEIRKVTARGKVQRDTRCFVIATVNNLAKFKALQAGALASRFPEQVHFKRPTRDTLARILTREIDKINGNSDWIKPCLDYCIDRKIDDPRTIISRCLCGGNGWLDGSYQEMLDATAMPDDEEGIEE